MDYDEQWRIFSDLRKKINDKIYKPDFVIFEREDSHKTEKIKIVVELKHWPKKEEIERDLGKSREYKIASQEDNPILIFMAIIGNKPKGMKDIVNQIKTDYNDIKILTACHDKIPYKGPYILEHKNDPWRLRMKFKV